MTVKQETVGAKADFGVVGFLQEKNVSYLLFPKSLARFKDARVIGIKYDLVESSAGLAGYSKPDKARAAARKVEDHPKLEPPPKPTKQSKPGKPTKALSERAPYQRKGAKLDKPSKPQPRFEVTVRFTAEAHMTTVVQASNQVKARRLAEEMLRPPDMARVGVTKRVVRVKKQG